MFEHIFKEPGCSTCEHYKSSWRERYCYGFKKRKNPKWFTTRDPKYKAPKWCPKRLAVSVVRLYRYKDASSRRRAQELAAYCAERNSEFMYASGTEYARVSEHSSGITAKEFYETSNDESWRELYGFELQHGDVVEIDTGLTAHRFFYHHELGFKPVVFDSEKIRSAAA